MAEVSTNRSYISPSPSSELADPTSWGRAPPKLLFFGAILLQTLPPLYLIITNRLELPIDHLLQLPRKWV